MNLPERKAYWFPAKRYGWGWGPLSCWQGWAVMAAFAMLVLLGALRVLPRWGQAAFLIYSLLLCMLLMAVCRAKGEPPRWRWGDKSR